MGGPPCFAERAKVPSRRGRRGGAKGSFTDNPMEWCGYSLVIGVLGLNRRVSLGRVAVAVWVSRAGHVHPARVGGLLDGVCFEVWG